jgi:hypothetical protein
MEGISTGGPVIENLILIVRGLLVSPCLARGVAKSQVEIRPPIRNTGAHDSVFGNLVVRYKSLVVSFKTTSGSVRFARALRLRGFA